MSVSEGVRIMGGDAVQIIAIGIVAVTISYASYREGYKKGYRDGYFVREALAVWEQIRKDRGRIKNAKGLLKSGSKQSYEEQSKRLEGVL